MSVGPSQRKEDPKVALSVRAVYTAKKVSEIFFQRPSYYIFHVGLALGMLFALFGAAIRWQFVVLLILSGALHFGFPEEIKGAVEKKK